MAELMNPTAGGGRMKAKERARKFIHAWTDYGDPEAEDLAMELAEAIRQAEAAAREAAVVSVRRHCPSCKGTGTYPVGECEHCTPQIRAIRAREAEG